MLNKVPLVLTILVHYNSVDDCCSIIQDLENCKYSNHKIVIVDNQSTDYSFRKLKYSLTNAKAYLIRNTCNNGYGGGINFGVEYGRQFNPGYIQVMNIDTRVINFSYMSEIVGQLEALPSAGIIGPAVMTPKGGSQNTIMPFVTLKGLFNFKKNFTKLSHIKTPPVLKEVEVLNGVCFIVRYKAFQNVNGFDEDYFMYGEEQDFCFRISRMGYFNYFYSIKSIIHYEDNSQLLVKEIIDWKYLLIRSNQVMYLMKNKNFFESCMSSLIFFISTVKKIIVGSKLKNLSILRVFKALVRPKSFNKSLVKSS